MKLTTLTRDWEGERVAIFASGPSMSPELAERRRGWRAIAINNQVLDCAPWADVIWSSDAKWWREYGAQVEGLPGRKLSFAVGMLHPLPEVVRLSPQVYDTRPEWLSGGGNSGYAAICLAARLGASVIELYGFDMRAVGGRFRRFEYGANLNSKPRFLHWMANFERLAPELAQRGVQVVNCTPGSALRCFKFDPRAEVA